MVFFFFDRFEEFFGGDGEVIVFDEDLHMLAFAVKVLRLLEIIEIS